MAEAKSPEHPTTLPTKRKPDDFGFNFDSATTKAQKLHSLTPQNDAVAVVDQEIEIPNSNGGEKHAQNDVVAAAESTLAADAEGQTEKPEERVKESVNVPVVDRKGKGILIEEAEEDDDSDDEDEDDSSDSSSDDSDDFVLSDGDSELSDDPLMEVDLDNILPSRTRQRRILPGIHIADNVSKAVVDDDEDDDSDDPDA